MRDGCGRWWERQRAGRAADVCGWESVSMIRESVAYGGRGGGGGGYRLHILEQ